MNWWKVCEENFNTIIVVQQEVDSQQTIRELHWYAWTICTSYMHVPGWENISREIVEGVKKNETKSDNLVKREKQNIVSYLCSYINSEAQVTIFIFIRLSLQLFCIKDMHSILQSCIPIRFLDTVAISLNFDWLISCNCTKRNSLLSIDTSRNWKKNCFADKIRKRLFI